MTETKKKSITLKEQIKYAKDILKEVKLTNRDSGNYKILVGDYDEQCLAEIIESLSRLKWLEK